MDGEIYKRGGRFRCTRCTLHRETQRDQHASGASQIQVNNSNDATLVHRLARPEAIDRVIKREVALRSPPHSTKRRNFLQPLPYPTRIDHRVHVHQFGVRTADKKWHHFSQLKFS